MYKDYMNCRAATLLKDKRTKSAIEEYALEVYSNWRTPTSWLCQDITDWDDNQYCQNLIVALRQESYRNYLNAQIKHAELEDKILGTHRTEKLRQQLNSGYCCLNDEIRANEKEAKERPNYYVVDGDVYYRDEALELYKEFQDSLISLDWGGKQDLIKVPTANLARWLAAMKAILASKQFIKLYTEDMPETKGGKARYGVCPDCGELFLLDEGRDNYCPNCDKLVLENQLIYNNTPEDYGYTSYKGDWVDLGADVSYEGLFRATADDEAIDHLDGINDVLDSLGLDNEDVGL